MKRIALYIILLSYTAVILKPVTPYITDAVAHIFYYTEHMATVHYEDGNFHVHIEVMDNAKKTESQKELPSSKKDNSTIDHIGLQQKELNSPVYAKSIRRFPLSPSLLYNYLAGEYPPPRD